MHVSLPVQLCNERSFVGSISNCFAYSPILLEKAAQSRNPVERLKAVVCNTFGILLLHLQIDKPFNPILGETYQALIDGCPVYGEQVSHHPPVSRFFMKGRGYTLYGTQQPVISIGLNSVSACTEGAFRTSFNPNDISKDVVVSGRVHG